MTQFIEKHRRLLQAYCLIARILGWVLLLGGVFWVFCFMKSLQTIPSGRIRTPEEAREVFDIVTYIATSVFYDFIIPGFLAFAIAGLLDYLLRPMKRPPLVLRITDKLCYIYAAFLILKAIKLNSWFERLTITQIPEIAKQTHLLLVQPLLVTTLAKILLLIGIGMILHRLLPVIEESKTLV
ncbi:MAG: hypothetical protein ABSB25_03830 [Sedimentisphaerales bacterium]|jgi:hypothetical protein